MEKIASYKEKEYGEIITVYKDEDNVQVLFMFEDNVKRSIGIFEYIEYETLSELNNTIDENDPKLEMDKSVKAALLQTIEDDCLKDEFKVIYEILKNQK